MPDTFHLPAASCSSAKEIAPGSQSDSVAIRRSTSIAGIVNLNSFDGYSLITDLSAIATKQTNDPLHRLSIIRVGKSPSKLSGAAISTRVNRDAQAARRRAWPYSSAAAAENNISYLQQPWMSA